MGESNESSQKIHILGDDVSRRIAAGEVVERPYSLVRELLDNSLDASPQEVSVYLEDGGVSSVRVVDDGYGMSPLDLKICFFPHATSKINDFHDLDTLSTLGFRGEALASMAACARLEIISARQGSPEPAHRLLVQGGKLLSFEAYRGKAGTTAAVTNLFFNMPARKRFLKQTAAETSMCKTVFMDKAVPFPEVAFKLFIDNELKLFLEKQTLLQRAAAVHNYSAHASLFFEQKAQGKGFSLTVICALPEIYRKDRRHIQLFVNKRRIFEYSLQQAVEYGFRGYLPGGLFPVCFVFLEISPELVDFNIHPAKKEVRIKNLPQIHQALVALIKGLLANHFALPPHSSTAPKMGEGKAVEGRPPEFIFPAQQARTPEKIFTARTAPVTLGNDTTAGSESYLYLGQLWKVFLLFARQDVLFIVDQHAAHERLLFDTFKNSQDNTQPLLFPICFEAEAEEKAILEKNIALFTQAGFLIADVGKNSFELKALPETLHVLPEAEIVAFLKSQEGTIDDLLGELHRRAACKMAVKEGEDLDELTAVELLKGVLDLENPRCPHGRPIYYTLPKNELYKLLGRII